MTARAAVTAILTEPGKLTGVDVLPYARNIDPPERSTVMVRTDEVRPSEVAEGLQDYRMALVLLAAKVEPGPGDDELDALLEDVLYVVTSSYAAEAGITWTVARRATYQEATPAYEIDISVTTRKEEPTP